MRIIISKLEYQSVKRCCANSLGTETDYSSERETIEQHSASALTEVWQVRQRVSSTELKSRSRAGRLQCCGEHRYAVYQPQRQQLCATFHTTRSNYNSIAICRLFVKQAGTNFKKNFQTMTMLSQYMKWE